MFGKLIILLALAGSLSSVASQCNSTDCNTTSTKSTTTTTTPSSTTASSTSTGYPEPSTPQGLPRNPKFPGPPPPHKHNRNPEIPIISDFINAINRIAQSLAPRPLNLGGPGGRRFRRGINFQGASNISVSVGRPSNGSQTGIFGIPNILNFEIPNVEDLVPEIPELSDPSNLTIPEIPNLPGLPMIPGLQEAANLARDMVANEIGAGADLATGIQNAIRDGLNSSNPTEAIRGIVSTILNTYLTVARNCPLFIVGGYLMREGLLLSSDVLRSIAAVIGDIQGV